MGPRKGVRHRLWTEHVVTLRELRRGQTRVPGFRPSRISMRLTRCRIPGFASISFFAPLTMSEEQSGCAVRIAPIVLPMWPECTADKGKPPHPVRLCRCGNRSTHPAKLHILGGRADNLVDSDHGRAANSSTMSYSPSPAAMLSICLRNSSLP